MQKKTRNYWNPGKWVLIWEYFKWELSNEYQDDRVSMVFQESCILVLWTKVVSALEGLGSTVDPWLISLTTLFWDILFSHLHNDLDLNDPFCDLDLLTWKCWRFLVLSSFLCKRKESICQWHQETKRFFRQNNKVQTKRGTSTVVAIRILMFINML